MEKLIVMTIYGINNSTYKEKISFINKIIGSCDEYGLIEGFNNAYGYKKVCSHTSTPLGGEYFYPEIKTPDSYIPPNSLLIQSATFLNKEKELMSFVVENKKVEHPNNNFSYDTISLLIQFQNFLYKKFNNIFIEFSFRKLQKDGHYLPLKDFALGYFMCCLAQSVYVNTEFSAHRQLKQKEIDYIMNIVNQLFDEQKFEFSQYYCETCASYNSDCPYHIELNRN